MTLFIDNKSARRLFIERHGLSNNPAARCTRHDIQAMIEKIGFVQVDSIRTVERAHHQILFSRHQTFKHPMLDELLQQDRTLFENWTHDAAIIPTQFYPYWKHRFARRKTRIIERWKKWGRTGITEMSSKVIRHITKNGPTFSRDLKPEKQNTKSKPGWWDWHPAKTSLEFLWQTGRTAISYRKNFQKAYDLAERVIPRKYYAKQVSKSDFIEWACSSALDRLGFATHGEIAAFWDIISPAEAKIWAEKQSSGLVQVEVQSFDKKSTRILWARPDIAKDIKSTAKPPPRLRILSPFDPMLRDRKRAEFLFGFHYRIEVFVPEAKRQYGYYVFPVMQGDRMIARIDMKADRKNGTLNIRRIWLEDKVAWTDARRAALDSELKRQARFSSLTEIHFDPAAFVQ